LVYTAETCEAPEIKLNNYKKAVQDITAKSKIVVPGKEQQKPSMDELVKAIMAQAEVKIPHIIVQQEATRLLSQTLDELKSLGISLDQYLASRNTNADELKKEYEAKAEQDLKLEFVLRKIADDEKITVEPKDIEEALKAITDQKQRETVAQNPYLVAAIIRQQKTLDFISKL
jgi:trigger factor